MIINQLIAKNCALKVIKVDSFILLSAESALSDLVKDEDDDL